MEEFVIKIAGIPIGVHGMYGSTREYFRKYLTQEPPLHRAEITPEDLAAEQQLLDVEADQEGLRRRVFTPPFLERTVIQRRTAEFLLPRNILLLHGSTIAVDGAAYLFTAKCGVGKSTHTRFWREVFGPRALTVNDDRAFLEIGETVLSYGSPWSGKHGLDNNICVPLAGICILKRGAENHIHSISPDEALPLLLDQAYLPCPGVAAVRDALTEALSKAVPLWQMQCTKSPDAALIAHNAMSSCK